MSRRKVANFRRVAPLCQVQQLVEGDLHFGQGLLWSHPQEGLLIETGFNHCCQDPASGKACCGFAVARVVARSLILTFLRSQQSAGFTNARHV
jgi:hypothetical protein